MCTWPPSSESPNSGNAYSSNCSAWSGGVWNCLVVGHEEVLGAEKGLVSLLFLGTCLCLGRGGISQQCRRAGGK